MNKSTLVSSTLTEEKLEHIPIDFIKAKVIGVIDKCFLEDEDFEFTPILRGTDEVIRYEYKKDNMKLAIMPCGRMILQGSLHKYITYYNQNHDMFTWSKFKLAIKKLEKEFKLKPENLWITQLEWGVNIPPPCQTKLILRNLFQHKKKDFEKPIQQGGDYHQVKHDRYYIKIYDKAKQYKLKKETIRLEIKQINWTEYRSKGIETLYDFIHSDKSIFLNILCQKINEIIFYDPLIPTTINSKLGNLRFWQELVDLNNTGEYKKQVLKLKSHNLKYGNGIKEKIILGIQNMVNFLQE